MSISGIMCNGTIHELLIPPTIARKTDLESKFVELKQYNDIQQSKIEELEQNNNVQNYCKTIKCYGLQKTNEKLYYCLGRPYRYFFKILFITIKGQIPFPKKIFMDMIPHINEIYTKYYNDLKDVKINNSYQFILKCKPL